MADKHRLLLHFMSSVQDADGLSGIARSFADEARTKPNGILAIDPFSFPVQIDADVTMAWPAFDYDVLINGPGVYVPFSIAASSWSGSFETFLNQLVDDDTYINIPVANSSSRPFIPFTERRIRCGRGVNDPDVCYESALTQTGNLQTWADRVIYSPSPGYYRASLTSQRMTMDIQIWQLYLFFERVGTTQSILRVWHANLKIVRYIRWHAKNEHFEGGVWVVTSDKDESRIVYPTFRHAFKFQIPDDPLSLSSVGVYTPTGDAPDPDFWTTSSSSVKVTSATLPPTP